MLGSVLTFLLNEMHRLPSGLVYTLVAALVFGEAALFIGFIIPGETTVIVAGVIASQGGINIGVLCALIVVAAVVGDSVGYLVGKRFGDRLLNLAILRRHRSELDDALAGLQKRGPLYVFLGRFTAFLRAVMPGLAGMSRLSYGRFFLANAAGGLVWGVGFALLGYAAGSQLHRIERYASWFSYGILILLLLVATSLVLWRRSRRRSRVD